MYEIRLEGLVPTGDLLRELGDVEVVEHEFRTVLSGSFQDQFLVHLREHEPCPNCGRPVRKLRAAGRGTYVCERCQPRPRAARRRAAA